MATFLLSPKVTPPAAATSTTTRTAAALRWSLPSSSSCFKRTIYLPSSFSSSSSIPAAITTAVRCSPSSEASPNHRRKRPEYIPNHIPDPDYVRIFDTTLRDGEQSPGAAMTPQQKLEIARQLARLGVDIIEAGFPASSAADLEAVKTIAVEVGNAVDEDGYVPVICGLSRCNRNDIDAAWAAVKYAKRPRIHTFIATSEIHMQHKLNKSKEEVIEIARTMVSYARSLGCNDVEFSPEDAGRSEREFLYQILGEVIKAGATTLNIPDTVGINVPFEFGQLISDIKANTPGIENVIISTHCQNDLGLSSANTYSGACAGARQLECTINGIGERAGNAALEEVVMNLRCREQLHGGLYTGIRTQHIFKASKMVSEYTGLCVQPHKAIVGANAFKHESGIHQHGMLKHKGTYEIMSPEDIGLYRADEAGLVLGKLSGRHALQKRLEQLGYFFEGKELDDIFWRFKAIAEKKKHVLDEDIEALVADELYKPESIWTLGGLQVACGTLGLSTASVKLIDANGMEHVACSVGTGPVDSAYKAIDMVVKAPVTLLEYSLSAVTEGIDALATTKVIVRGEDDYTFTHTLNGESVQRTFSLSIVFPQDSGKRPFCSDLRLQPLSVNVSTMENSDSLPGAFILTDQETVDYYYMVLFLPSLLVFLASVTYLVAGVFVAYSTSRRHGCLKVVENSCCASKRGGLRCLAILNSVFALIFCLLALFLGSSLLTVGSSCTLPLFWCYEIATWGLVILHGGTAFSLRRRATAVPDGGDLSGRYTGLEMLEASPLEITPDVERRVTEGFKTWMGSSLLSSDDEDEQDDDYVEVAHRTSTSVSSRQRATLSGDLFQQQV